MITVDIESTKIVPGAPLAPRPTGIAIRYPDGETHYWAWGHPSGNNCTESEALDIIMSIWRKEWLTHNGLGFDVPVLERHFKLPPRDPLLTHDTLFLAYLHNPHARSLSLKDLGNDWLSIPATEQRDLQDWILANVPECKTRSQCGAYISEAPADIVAPYAMQDTELTYQLFKFLQPLVLPAMQEPYDRECKLAPILADIQYRGVRLDYDRLVADTRAASEELERLDQAVRDTLCCPDLDLNKDAQLLAALRARGYDHFLTTPKGATSAAKDSLDLALAEAPELRELLKRRSVYSTLVSTFLLPWQAIGGEHNHRLYPTYNQVRNPDGFGTRTGRLSSSQPNLQNVPGNQGEGYPVMRSYTLPEPGHVWFTGDFKSQEPRLAAHYEGGSLLAQYQADPDLDPYLWIASECSVERKEAKVVFLGLLYAMGAQLLADRLGCTYDVAAYLRSKIKIALPDVVELDSDAKRRWKLGLPIKTLGSRLYHCEPPSNGRTWEYKALNTLIQGSAADMTKEAIIYIHNNLPLHCRILGTVHDEISVSCLEQDVPYVQHLFEKAANLLKADVTFLMDCKYGSTWAEAK
jgi:DNA polymerase-1